MRVPMTRRNGMPTMTQSTEATSAQGSKSSDGDKDRGGGSALERVTVNLTMRSVAAMDKLVDLTGDTKTETINKALQFYAHIQEFLDSGGALYMRDPDSDELERIKIF
jgi:hypothetical protein